MKIDRKPLLLVFIVLASVIVVGLLPLEKLVGLLELDEFSLNIRPSLVNIINYAVAISLLLVVIFKSDIRIHLFEKTPIINYLFLIPAIAYLFVFSGMNTWAINRLIEEGYFVSIVFTAETFLGAAFEELLFRGVVFSLVYVKFQDEKNGLIKSVIVSSLLFGLMHILNLWTNNASLKSVFNQMYAAFCIGVLWLSIYLKTKSLILIILIHFVSNYFAKIEAFLETQPAMGIISDKSIVELVFSEVLRIIIFGIPLLIGLYIINTIKDKQLFS